MPPCACAMQSPTSSLHSSMGSPGKKSPSTSPSGFGSSSSTGRSDKARSRTGPLHQSMVSSPGKIRSTGSSAGFGSSAATGRVDSSAELKALRGRMSSTSTSMTKIPSPLGKSTTARSALAVERAKLRSTTSSPRAQQSPRETPKPTSPSKDVLWVSSDSKPAPPSPEKQAKTSTRASPRGTINYPTTSAARSPRYKPQAIPGTARGIKSRTFKSSQPALSGPKGSAQTSDPVAAVPSRKSGTADLGTNASQESLAAFLKVEAAETKRQSQLPVSHPAPGSNPTELTSSQESVENAIRAVESDAGGNGGDKPVDHVPLDPVDEDAEADAKTSFKGPSDIATRTSSSGSPWRPAGVLSHNVRTSLDPALPRSPRLLRKSIDSPRSSPRGGKSTESMPTAQYESRRDGSSSLAVPTDSPLRKSSSSSSTDFNRVRTSSVIRSPNSRPLTRASSDKPPAALELDEDDSNSDAGSVEVCRQFPKTVSRYGSFSEDKKPLHPEASISPRNLLTSDFAEKDIAMLPLNKGAALASRPVSASIDSNATADEGAGGQFVASSTEEVKALDSMAVRESQMIENEDIGWIASMRASCEANVSEDLPVHIANALDTSTDLSPGNEKKSLANAPGESTGVIEEIVPANSTAKEARETNLAQKIQEVLVYTSGQSPKQIRSILASPAVKEEEAPQRKLTTSSAPQSLRSIVPRDKQSRTKRGWVEALRVSAVSAVAGLATNVVLRAVLKDDGRFPMNDPGIRPSQYRDTFDTFLEDSWRKAT